MFKQVEESLANGALSAIPKGVAPLDETVLYYATELPMSAAVQVCLREVKRFFPCRFEKVRPRAWFGLRNTDAHSCAWNRSTRCSLGT